MHTLFVSSQEWNKFKQVKPFLKLIVNKHNGDVNNLKEQSSHFYAIKNVKKLRIIRDVVKQICF